MKFIKTNFNILLTITLIFLIILGIAFLALFIDKGFLTALVLDLNSIAIPKSSEEIYQIGFILESKSAFLAMFSVFLICLIYLVIYLFLKRKYQNDILNLIMFGTGLFVISILSIFCFEAVTFINKDKNNIYGSGTFYPYFRLFDISLIDKYIFIGVFIYLAVLLTIALLFIVYFLILNLKNCKTEYSNLFLSVFLIILSYFSIMEFNYTIYSKVLMLLVVMLMCLRFMKKDYKFNKILMVIILQNLVMVFALCCTFMGESDDMWVYSGQNFTEWMIFQHQKGMDIYFEWEWFYVGLPRSLYVLLFLLICFVVINIISHLRKKIRTI